MISAIVLAAGLSTRMGQHNKLLLPINGEAIVRIVVTRLLAAGPGEVIVVLGHEKEAVKAALSGLDIKFVINDKYQEGMTSSIQAGVNVANGSGYMICLSDMYAIEAAEYMVLAAFFTAERQLDPECICVPVFKGSKGNPVIFSNTFCEKILAHEEPEGCQGIVLENKFHLKKIDMQEPHVMQDLDYPEDYRQLQKL